MRYTPEHEWLDANDGVITVGITEHAAEQLGDVVFIELPEVGTEVAKGDEIAVIESVKAASDILAPLDGKIVAVNAALAEDPAALNADPAASWFFKMTLTDPAALDAIDAMMDHAAYQAFIAQTDAQD